MKLVDTNFLIRLAANDLPDQAGQARDLVKSAAAGELSISDAVLSEVCFVLEFNALYGWERQKVNLVLEMLLRIKAFTVSAIARLAIRYFQTHPKLDFVDCLLPAQSELSGFDVLTFDKELKQLITSKD